MNLLGLAGDEVIDSLNAKRIRPEFTQDETGEETIDVSSNLRAGIDHTNPLVRIDSVSSIQAHLRFTVKALRSENRQQERGFDILEVDRGAE
jgi:hypothetical protein